MKKILFGITGGKTRFITYTAVLVALTVAAQYFSSLAQIQLLTGSIVNMFLIVTTAVCGALGGTIAGLVTPFIATAIGINQNIVVVPFIALSNAVLVWVFSLSFLVKTNKVWLEYAVKVCAIIVAAAIKFVFMRYVCVAAIFPLFVGAEWLKPQAVKNLATAWGFIQLFTALIGGAAALVFDFALNIRKILPAKKN